MRARDMRTSPRQRQTFSARQPARATGGYVDPARVTVPGRCLTAAERKAIALTDAEAAERARYDRLIIAWKRAPKGDAKRACLTALRAFERGTGREPYMLSALVSATGTDVTVDTAEGTGWGERK